MKGGHELRARSHDQTVRWLGVRSSLGGLDARAEHAGGRRRPAAIHEHDRRDFSGNAADTATRNVLTLNTIMFDLYGDAARIFTKNILAQHPVILALFSGAGGA